MEKESMSLSLKFRLPYDSFEEQGMWSEALPDSRLALTRLSAASFVSWNPQAAI